MDNVDYVVIRCLSERPHLSKGVMYQQCGSLLAGVNIEEDCDIVVRCKICKSMWRVISDDDG